MSFDPITEDAFTELNILREKAEAVLYYAIEEPQCARQQTLNYIAGDFSEMGEIIRVMQERKVAVPG